MPTNSTSLISQTVKGLSKSSVKYNIIEFAESKQALNQSIFPVQKFFLKVFDKMPLEEEIPTIELRDKFNQQTLRTLTEREYYDFLLADGRVSLPYEEYLESDTVVYLLAWGRRASKSTMVSIIAAYKLYQILNIPHPQKYFGILENENMNISITALGQDNATNIFSKFYNTIKNCPIFKPHLREEASGGSLKVWTQNDLDALEGIQGKLPPHSHSINVVSQANTPGVRGEGNFVVIMDEAAHFNNSPSSTREKPLDVSIYEALTPSVSAFTNPDGTPFGVTFMISSVGPKHGKFYEEYMAAFNLGATSGNWAMKAPTWEVNPIVSTAHLKSEYAKSPNSYDQEYGSTWSEGGKAWISDLEVYYRAVVKSMNALIYNARVDRRYFLGADFALSGDGTSYALAHLEPNYVEKPEDFVEELSAYCNTYDDLLEEIAFYEENPGKAGSKFVVDYSEVRYAGKPPYEDHKKLSIYAVLDWLEEIYERFPIQYGIYDQWSGELINQLISSRGIPRIDMVSHDAKINHTQYTTFSQLLHEGILKLPYDPELDRELLTLVEKKNPNGMLKVEAPPNGHDDRFDGIIRAVYLAHAYTNNIKVLGNTTLNNMFHNQELINRGGLPSSFKNAGSAKAARKMKERLHQGHLSIRKPVKGIRSR